MMNEHLLSAFFFCNYLTLKLLINDSNYVVIYFLKLNILEKLILINTTMMTNRTRRRMTDEHREELLQDILHIQNLEKSVYVVN